MRQGLEEHAATGRNHVDPGTPPAGVLKQRPGLAWLNTKKAGTQLRLCSSDQQAAVSPNDVVVGMPPAPAKPAITKKTLADFAANDETVKRGISLHSVLPAEAMAHKWRDTLTEVDHSLVSTSYDTPKQDRDKRVEFHNYFLPTTWIMADVFIHQDLAHFRANEAIEKQAELAGMSLEGLHHIIIKNIVNEPTKHFFKDDLEGNRFDGARMHIFMTSTPLGKLANRVAKCAPIAIEVYKKAGLVVRITLDPSQPKHGMAPLPHQVASAP